MGKPVQVLPDDLPAKGEQSDDGGLFLHAERLADSAGYAILDHGALAA